MPLCPHGPGQEHDFSWTWRGKASRRRWEDDFLLVFVAAQLCGIKCGTTSQPELSGWGSHAGGVFQALVLKTTRAWVFWFHPLVLLISPVSGSG